MTAPALILVTDGFGDPRVEQVAHSLRREMQVRRTELSIHLAFTDKSKPTLNQVLASLTNRKVKEAVLVPLEVTRVAQASHKMVALFEEARTRYPSINISLARPLGPAPEFLNIVDERLRAALTTNRCWELDGLVLLAPDCGDTRGNGLLARRARQWASHHKLPVTSAVGDGAGQSVSAAIAALREQGRRNIAVGALFLAATQEFHQQAEAAIAAGAIAFSAPFGPDPRMTDIIMSRYAFAAMNMLGDNELDLETEMLVAKLSTI